MSGDKPKGRRIVTPEIRGTRHQRAAGRAEKDIRQSTPRQVLENTESTKRQYALRQRASALGSDEDRIVLIDSDPGHSAATPAARSPAPPRQRTPADPQQASTPRSGGRNNP